MISAISSTLFLAVVGTIVLFTMIFLMMWNASRSEWNRASSMNEMPYGLVRDITFCHAVKPVRESIDPNSGYIIPDYYWAVFTRAVNFATSRCQKVLLTMGKVFVDCVYNVSQIYFMAYCRRNGIPEGQCHHFVLGREDRAVTVVDEVREAGVLIFELGYRRVDVFCQAPCILRFRNIWLTHGPKNVEVVFHPVPVGLKYWIIETFVVMGSLFRR